MNKERQIIAVCASWEDSENLNLFLSSLIPAAAKWDYLPLCVTFDRNMVLQRGEEGIREYLSLIEKDHLAGLVLFGEMIRSDEINQKLIQMANEIGIPIFMLERTYEGCINVQHVYAGGFEQIVRHMVFDHGRKDVVMVAGFKDNSYSEERIEICRKVLAEAGTELRQDRIIYGDYWEVPATEALKQYFASGGEMPEAFICANDAMAIAVCNYLKGRGIAVPEQVIVSGFDGIVLGKWYDPMITTAVPDFDKTIAEMLNRISTWKTDDAGNTEYIQLPFIMERRRSCGCANRSVSEFSEVISSLMNENLDYARHIKEMGQFVRETLSMDSVDKLAEVLNGFFVRWPEPYYCVSALDVNDTDYAVTMLHGGYSQFTRGRRYRWRGAPLPDYETVSSNPNVCAVMVHLLQTMDETMGLIVCGTDHWSLRVEQRFEEQAIFLSAAFSAVLNNKRLREANTEILKIAEHDYLTGLFNRRGFFDRLDSMLDESEMQGKLLVLFSIDLDWLKKINDVYGHVEGDRAIQSIGRALELEAEGRGACARYGGDEFALAIFVDELPDSVEPYRARIEANAHSIAGDKPYTVCASMGMCARKVRERPMLEQMLAEADKALYEDKRQRKTSRK